MNKYIGKIIIVTNMRKIPRSCAECGYYDGMGNRPSGQFFSRSFVTRMPRVL